MQSSIGRILLFEWWMMEMWLGLLTDCILYWSKACEEGPSRPSLVREFIVMGFREDMVVKAIEENGRCSMLQSSDSKNLADCFDGIYQQLFCDLQGKVIQKLY